jgi:hypothetical protein
MPIVIKSQDEPKWLSMNAADFKPRRKRPLEREHHEQVALFKWAKMREKRIPELALMYAIPNGGKRSKAVAGKLKAEGVKAGVPDICMPVARGKHHGLYIELKAPGGKPSDTQSKWIKDLSDQGYYACVCVGWENAKTVIEAYLNNGMIAQRFILGMSRENS